MIYSIFLLVFLLENFSLSTTYKNIFSREPRVYKICGIDKWKNSENYIKNYNNQSYIKLVGDVDIWIKVIKSLLNSNIIRDYYINKSI